MTRPSFLDLAEHASKPRSVGVTHVLDKGLPLPQLRGLLETAGEYVDIWKLGWGTAYLDRQLVPKIRLLEQHGVRACLGGTLLEIAWAQGRADNCLDWAHAMGFPMVEVSRGVMPLGQQDKSRLIRRASERFTVVSEVGLKDERHQLPADEWGKEAARDLDSGALLVVAEGRESGTVGVYAADGSVRDEVVGTLVSVAGVERILFEAPGKDQQAWFIKQFGADVNLGNIVAQDVLGLEALRLGLRADTALQPSW
jgi:phosphosulfolactate synthase